MNTLLIALLSIAISVAAQFLLKAGLTDAGARTDYSGGWLHHTVVPIATSPLILLGFALYGLGAVAWLGVLSRWDVSKAYPLVGLGFAMSVVVGWLLGEQVSAGRVLGACLICVGVVLVVRS